MVMNIFLLCCLLPAYGVSQTFKIEPVVSTTYGDVKGSVMGSRGGRAYSSFRGIPYAKPPVGDLRFKSPEEPEPWTDVVDATKDANMCIQQNYLFSQNPEIEGSEDCLYINVYTPLVRIYVLTSKLVKLKADLMPVMVFIHYGAFMAGSSSSDLLGPKYFMDRDVLLVTFNYRLGIFGFLSTYDDAAPGNWGFKDQVAALRWIQKNIEQFGGDPKKVTIFGASAGAGSVHYHLLNLRSEGLFHAAISQSGSALALWAQPQRELALEVARIQANLVGCNGSVSTAEIVACLREIPASKLVDSLNLFRFMRSEPLTVYPPTIEFETENNPEPFITKDPIDSIQNGEFLNVPWIIGVASNEGILRAAPFTRQTDLLKTINDNFDENFIKMLYLQMSVEQSEIPSTWSKIKEFYFSNKTGIDVNDYNSVEGLINVYSDRGFLYPAYQAALLHRHKGHEKIWFYYLDYRGNQSYGDVFAGTQNDIDFPWEACHCDDLLYLFHSPKLFPNYTSSSNDLQLSYLMLNLFTNLATYLDPTPGADLRNNIESWRPLPSTEDKEIIENKDLYYLIIAGQYSMTHNAFELRPSTGFLPERMSFWKQLPLKENIENVS